MSRAYQQSNPEDNCGNKYNKGYQQSNAGPSAD